MTNSSSEVDIDTLLVEEDDKLLAAFCYLVWFFVSPVVLMTRRNVPFLKFHALQSIFFGVLSSALCGIIGLVVWGFLQAGAEQTDLYFGAFLMILYGGYMFVFFIFFCFFLYFAWQAMQGKIFRIPLVGPLAFRMAAPADERQNSHAAA